MTKEHGADEGETSQKKVCVGGERELDGVEWY